VASPRFFNNNKYFVASLACYKADFEIKKRPNGDELLFGLREGAGG